MAEPVKHLLVAGQAFVGGSGRGAVGRRLPEPLLLRGQVRVLVRALKRRPVQLADLVAQEIPLAVPGGGVAPGSGHGLLHLAHTGPGGVARPRSGSRVRVETMALRRAREQ